LLRIIMQARSLGVIRAASLSAFGLCDLERIVVNIEQKTDPAFP
jgi:hypothetical protein